MTEDKSSDPGPAEQPRGTMPPPELLDRTAPVSAGQLALASMRREAPVPRHRGARAEHAYLIGRLSDAQALGDDPAERTTSIALARLLASRGTDLDQATKLARRALSLGDDPSLRTELSGWLASLGEPALAAATLRALVDPEKPAEATKTLIRIAVLLARADDPAGAADALDEAAELSPKEAIAHELTGTVAAWAPDEVPPAQAAQAYLRAAAIREAAGDREAAFEDRLRAIEAAPDFGPGADAVAAALLERGRAGAADEVMRVHADSLDAEAAAAVHKRRFESALVEGNHARAIGAALDGRFEVAFSHDHADKLDELLTITGLYELLAARLSHRAAAQAGRGRAGAFAQLARLYAGPLASPERATEAWIAALAADPTDADCRAALADQAELAGESAPLVEAYVRALLSDERVPLEGRRHAATALAELAETELNQPVLATWALERLAKLGGDRERVAADRARLETGVRRHRDELEALEQKLEAADDADARLDALRAISDHLSLDPGQRARQLEVLAAIGHADPTDVARAIRLDRLIRRLDPTPLTELELYESVLRRRAEAPLARGELVRTRLALAGQYARRQDYARALDEAAPLAREAAGHRWAASSLLLFATLSERSDMRGEALVQLAGPASGALRATLLAVASDAFLAASRFVESLRCAEQAVEADPTNARALAALATSVVHIRQRGTDAPARADVALATNHRSAAAAIERAMTVVVPRSHLCEQLSTALEAQGEKELRLALAWTQRWLALRPGDRAAATTLIRRAAGAKDAARLSDALSWVLAQPAPLDELAAPLLSALDELDRLDRQRAMSAARRALDVLGPRNEAIRRGLLTYADNARHASLAITVLERWLASDPDADPAALLELARRRVRAEDFDGAARELCRALAVDLDPDDVADVVVELQTALSESGQSLSSDGKIAMAEVEAQAITVRVPAPESRAAPSSRSRNGEQDQRIAELTSQAARAWRELGSLRWDLADDWRGAEQAFFAASTCDPTHGIATYLRDLKEFAGPEDALEAVGERIELDEELTPSTRIDLLLAMAQLALELGQHDRAAKIAMNAIELDPRRADAVALVETSVTTADAGGLRLLDSAYESLASAALGCFGRRAAHYRASRQLERRGALALAVKHASKAFEAVPSEGTTFVNLARLAARAGDPSVAVEAVERVAESGDPHERAVWLKRAASLASGGDDAMLRLDVLLRALSLSPDGDTLAEVTKTVETVPASQRADALTKLAASLRALLESLRGPGGAMTAIGVAKIAFGQIGDADFALEALRAAVDADPDLSAYSELAADLEAIDDPSADAGEIVGAVKDLAGDPHRSVAVGLLQSAAALAGKLGDLPGRCELLIAAYRKEPDNDRILAAARHAAIESGHDEALAELERIEASSWHPASGTPSGPPASLLSGVRSLLSTATTTTERRRARGELVEVARDESMGPLDEEDARGLIEMLEQALAHPDLELEEHAELSYILAERLVAANDPKQALSVIGSSTEKMGRREVVSPWRELLELQLTLASRQDDRALELDAWQRLLPAIEDESDREAAQRRIIELADAAGDRQSAGEARKSLIEAQPGDLELLEELERDAQSRGDHDAVAALLKKRIERTEGDKQRLLRLRRAAVLEQRLGQLEEAASELEVLIEERPDDRSALPFLADVYARLGADSSAAPLWARLAEMATDEEERADYGARAVKSYLDGGDPVDAERVLESLGEPKGSAELQQRLWALRAEVARGKSEPGALADALSRQAAATVDEQESVRLHLEASRAYAAMGESKQALVEARKARDLRPMSAEAVLEARRLEYMVSGTGTPRAAQAAVDELYNIEDEVTPEQMELYAFLLAEQLDVIQGGGAGMRELTRRHAEVGPRPLVALGMAERLMRSSSQDAAVPLFEKALGGDLRGLRRRGRVALHAADAAIHVGLMEVAARLLEEAAAEPETHKAAARRQLELTAARGDPDAAKAALEELAAQSDGVSKARVLGQLARLVAPDAPEVAVRHYEAAVESSRGDRALADRLHDELAELRLQRAASSSEPPARQSSGAPPPLRRRRDRKGAPPVSPLPPALPVPGLKPRDRDDVQPSPAASSDPPAETEQPKIITIPPDSPRTPPPGEVARKAASDSDAPETVFEPASPSVLEAAALDETEAAAAEDDVPVAAPSTASRARHPLAGTLPSAEGTPTPAARAVRVAVEEAPPPESEPPAPLTVPDSQPEGDPAPKASDEVRSEPPVSNSEPPLSLVLPPMSRPAVETEGEGKLLAALIEGSVEAGEELAQHYADKGPTATHDLLTVRRYLALLEPGDRQRLDDLYDAAIADKNLIHARAVDHVRRAFDPDAEPLDPPPAEAQALNPELVVRIIERDLPREITRALGVVWETGMFRRDPSSYGLTGLERVQPSMKTVVAKVYTVVARTLGVSSPLFFKRGEEKVTADIALTTPPAVVLRGSVDEDSLALRYRLGVACFSSLSNHALISGGEERANRILIDALIAAFGPVDHAPLSFVPGSQGPHSPRASAELAKISGELWQVVSARADRMLRELCADPDNITFDKALLATQTARRRAGLMVCGDIATAFRLVMEELNIELDVPLGDPDGLREACARHPALGDLCRFAVLGEYADARWEVYPEPRAR